MKYAQLKDRTVLSLAGKDVIPFLQGLITNDATLLATGQPIYALLLSPQGKFLHDFFLIPDAERILLDVNKDRVDDLIARLKIYKLRSKVDIERTDIEVTASWSHTTHHSPPTTHHIKDPRHTELGERVYGGSTPQGELADYETHRIALGVPDGAKDLHIDKSLPLEFGLETFNAISFSKGCYVGQEVTARSKFRGQLRKALYRISATTPLPPLGTPVIQEGKTVGELRSVSGSIGLALLATEAVEQNATPLIAGDTPLLLL